MVLERLRVGEWLAGAGGLALAISLFLPWWGLRGEWIGIGPGGPIEGGVVDSPDAVTTWSAWQVLSVADVLLALLALGAMAVWVVVARAATPGPGLAAEALLTPLALAMTIVVVVQLLTTPDSLEVPPPIPDPSIEVGAWLGMAATLAILLGLLAGMRDERLSLPGRPTDQTGAPLAARPPVETLPGPPPA